MTEEAGPRWKTGGILGGPGLFIGRAGSLDLYHCAAEFVNIGHHPLVVCDRDRIRWNHAGGRGFNYTRFKVTDGNLKPLDDDVIPTPLEMCQIYQMWHDYKTENNL